MNIKVLSKELSKELGESADLIEKVGRSEFKLLWNTIHAGNLDSVYLKYIGRFGIKPERMKYFGKRKQLSSKGNTDS